VGGGPRYGGTDSAMIEVGIWNLIPVFHRNDEILKFNFAKALSKLHPPKGALILEVGPDEAIFCFRKEYAEYLNGVSSQ
jgi:hypothetical protein